MFIDTGLITTKSYAKFFFNEVPNYEPWVEAANKIDYYIYLDSSAPYVNDGTRLPEEKRNELNKAHIKMFTEQNLTLYKGFHYYNDMHYTKGIDPYEFRLKEVIEYINYLTLKLWAMTKKEVKQLQKIVDEYNKRKKEKKLSWRHLLKLTEG